MILVTGSILTTDETTEAVLAAGLEHTRRSRTEPGCISHDVLRDAENPLRVVFLERWESRDALHAHFALADSIEFVRAITPLAAEAPQIDVFDTTPSSA